MANRSFEAAETPLRLACEKFAYGDLAGKKGSYHAAAGFYREGIDYFPGITPAEWYTKLSDACLFGENFRSAVSALEECLEVHPDDCDILFKIAELHIDQWRDIYDPQKALKYFERIKDIDPNYRARVFDIDTSIAWTEMLIKEEEKRRMK